MTVIARGSGHQVDGSTITWMVSRIVYPARSTAFWIAQCRVSRWQFFRAALRARSWEMLRSWMNLAPSIPARDVVKVEGTPIT